MTANTTLRFITELEHFCMLRTPLHFSEYYLRVNGITLYMVVHYEKYVHIKACHCHLQILIMMANNIKL